MTDKELLELAAKSMGYEFKTTDLPEGHHGLWLVGKRFHTNWNPLQDDGDAFQLMVELNIQPIFSLNEWGDFVNTSILESEYDGEKFQTLEEKSPAARRAIVRGAAEIGKGMS